MTSICAHAREWIRGMCMHGVNMQVVMEMAVSMRAQFQQPMDLHSSSMDLQGKSFHSPRIKSMSGNQKMNLTCTKM